MTTRFFEPPSEDKSQVTVMVVDPYCVHVYWSIRTADLTRLRQQLTTNASTQQVLRFYDLTNSSAPDPPHFDIPLTTEKKHRYVDLWADDKRYLVELGLKDQTGRFGMLARAQIVATPRAKPIAAAVPTVFLRRDITPPVPVTPVPLEFSISLEERAAHTRQWLARYFPNCADTAPRPSQADDQAKPSPSSAWSASLPRGQS